MSIPADIPGLGATTQKLRVASGFDPMKAGVGPEEYFVLSRIDGSQSIREVVLATGLPIERALQILSRLRSIGALLLPGEAAPPTLASGTNRMTTADTMPASRTVTPVASSAPVQRPPVPVATKIEPATPPARPSQPMVSRTATGRQRTAVGTGTPDSVGGPPDRVLDLSLPNPTPDELAALRETAELDETDRRRILTLARLVGQPAHVLLGVASDADAKRLKRAYFQLSKDVHPDRFYGKKLGSFGPRMSAVFEAVSRAYAQLTNPPARSAPQQASSNRDQPQTPQEYAAELFERACAVEVSGNPLEAMKLFAAAVRMDPQLRYLRRATTCALAAGQPKTAVEYAKKAQSQAPDDPSAARLLARSFREAGKLSDAEEVLIMAMAMKSENDTLGTELRNDLAEVRRLLGNST